MAEIEDRVTTIENEIRGAREDLTEILELFRVIKKGKTVLSWCLKTLLYVGGVCMAITSIIAIAQLLPSYWSKPH